MADSVVDPKVNKAPGKATEQKWNDEALVKVWNEALNRHSDYQNLHSSGGTKEHLEEIQDDEDEEMEGDEATNSGGEGLKVTFDLTAKNELTAYDFDDENDPSGLEPTEPNGLSTAEAQSGMPPPPPPPVFPSSFKDENLKKLVMAWYYSGYYTGFWEGSQQAQKLQGQEGK